MVKSRAHLPLSAFRFSGTRFPLKFVPIKLMSVGSGPGESQGRGPSPENHGVLAEMDHWVWLEMGVKQDLGVCSDKALKGSGIKLGKHDIAYGHLRY